MKKFFMTLLLLLLIGGAGAAAWLWIGQNAAGPLSAEVTVVVERGTGFKGVARRLKEEGVIANEWRFMIPVLIKGEHKSIKAGEYLFPAGVSAREVVAKMTRGEVVVHSITVPEGLTVSYIGGLLATEPLLTGDIPEGIEEGTLLPDTYNFLRGDTRASVIARMQKAMTEVLDAAWEDRADDLPLKDAREALVLASIVEKETGVPSERARVAAVYVNRLRIGMMLQADPTVVYGIEQEIGDAMRGPLTTAGLKHDTPYNTYTRAGLPPTPIACPGRASIEATLHPADTKDLYFVATGDGGHNFAETMKEHEANVRAYRAAKRAAKP